MRQKMRQKMNYKKKIALFFRQVWAVIDKYQSREAGKGYFFSFVLLPVLVVFGIESMARHSMLQGLEFVIFHPYAFLANVLIVLTSFTITLFLTKRIGTILLLTVFWLAWGLVDGIVLLFRVTPFTSSDLLLVKDGMDVASKYLNPAMLAMLVVLVAAVLAVAILLVFKTPSVKKKPGFVVSAGGVVVAGAVTWCCIAIGQNTGLLENQFRELSQSYKKNGFLYCFGASLLNSGVSRPDDYSTEAIEELTENYEEADPVFYTDRPNVVVVQLESFFDVNRLKNFKFSQNPLPNFTELMGNYASGFLSVPVIGAGTVNSEFEMLTGMNIDDFGIGEYPYKTILKSKACESLAYNLKDYGYKSFAIHDNTGDFYERNKVYPNLGFDVFTSVEYMWPKDYTAMDWAKDSVLTGEIQKALDSTERPDFVFTVSVQGHGSYPTDGNYVHHILVSADEEAGLSEEYVNQVSYYVNQLYEMDQFIGDLLNMLRRRREPVILVLYGDHCPSLDLTDEALSSGTIYDTEYVIWNNAGFSFTDQKLQAYEVGSQILEALGITDGAVNAYHQNSSRELKKGAITEEGYLNGLKKLEYDILYGEQIRYNGEDPYEPTEIQMGFEPVVIESVSVTKDQVMIVKGENFTRYSVVHMDGSEEQTLYLDPETLVVPLVSMEDGAQITVSQASLSETAPYTYKAK